MCGAMVDEIVVVRGRVYTDCAMSFVCNWRVTVITHIGTHAEGYLLRTVMHRFSDINTTLWGPAVRQLETAEEVCPNIYTQVVMYLQFCWPCLPVTPSRNIATKPTTLPLEDQSAGGCSNTSEQQLGVCPCTTCKDRPPALRVAAHRRARSRRCPAPRRQPPGPQRP